MPLAGHLYYIWCSFIEPQHEKISICFCADAPFFFWVNSQPRMHGVGQVPLAAGITNGIEKGSYVDLSGVKMFAEKDLAKARDFGPIEPVAKALILAELSAPIPTLADLYRELALANLS
jgi:hypothetical protein